MDEGGEQRQEEHHAQLGVDACADVALCHADALHDGEAGGVEYFIVEQDECLKDPFDSLKESLDYITANFVK